MYFREYIAGVLAESDPEIRGVIDGQYIRRFLKKEASGPRAIFHFDVIGEIPFRLLVTRPHHVVLEFQPHWRRMKLPHIQRFCPSCSLELRDDEFWSHYNEFHARRPFWINEEHWIDMAIPGRWPAPPEQQC